MLPLVETKNNVLLLPNFQRSFGFPSLRQDDKPSLSKLILPPFFWECKCTSHIILSQNFFKIFCWFSISLRELKWKFLGRTAKIQYDDFTANFYCDNCSHSSHNLFIRYEAKTLLQMNISENWFRLFLKAGRKDKQRRFTGKSFLKIKNWNYQKGRLAKLSDNKNRYKLSK